MKFFYLLLLVRLIRIIKHLNYDYDIIIWTVDGLTCIFLKWNEDCTMGGNSIIIGKRIGNASNDGVLDHLPLPIPSEDLPLRLPFTSNAEPFRLHLRNCLVGDCSQFDCLFRRLTRKFLSYIYI